MGYYSDVRIIVSKKGYKKLYDYVEQQIKINSKKDMNNLMNTCSIKINNDNLYYMGWDYIKWYPIFPNVQLIMNGLEMLKEQNLSYDFCRIGEELDDYETHSSFSEEDDLIERIDIDRKFNDSNMIPYITKYHDGQLNYRNDNGYNYDILELDNVHHYALLQRTKNGKYEYNVVQGFYLNLPSWKSSTYFNDLEAAQEHYMKLKSKDTEKMLYTDKYGYQYEILEVDNINQFALLKKEDSTYLVVENFEINSPLTNQYPFDELIDAQECYIALKCDKLEIEMDSGMSL